jgi:hypothetical protein
MRHPLQSQQQLQLLAPLHGENESDGKVMAVLDHRRAHGALEEGEGCRSVKDRQHLLRLAPPREEIRVMLVEVARVVEE